MYCTVCLFLQSKFSEIRNEEQSKATHFHLPHLPTIEDHKKGPKRPPKETPKASSGGPDDAPKRSPNLPPFKNRFCRWKLCGGFGVCMLWDLQMGPRLYMYIYIYIYRYTLESTGALRAPLILLTQLLADFVNIVGLKNIMQFEYKTCLLKSLSESVQT